MYVQCTVYRLTNIILKVCGQHAEIQRHLTELHEVNSKILSLVADVRYKDGFETIDAIYTTFLTGRTKA